MKARFCRLLSTMQSRLDAFFAPPAAVRGMRQLDRVAFRREVTLPAVFLQEPSLCSKFLRRLQHAVLRYPRIRRVQERQAGGGKEEKVLLLVPDSCLDTPLAAEDFAWISENGGEMGSHTLTLDYHHYSPRAILTAVLPSDSEEIPTGFEVVGHIAHLNLRKEFLPYKTLIGEVVLDQQSSIRTVVNKTDSIDNTFRFFSMELLAGEDNMVATVSENGCTFSFDFSKVYWNSRLHTEHERVVGMLKRGNVVLDMFAGVGPFAIPAAKKGCTVYANDLNPSSYEALVKNVQKNKVTVNAFNMDGAEFLRKIIPQLIEQALGDPSPAPVICSQIIMNLPAIAPQFLGTFRGIFLSVPESRRSDILLPTVHCYCFCKSQHPDKESREMVETHLGSHLKEGSFSIFKVRLVAPNKAMMRVTFELPGDVPYMSVCERVSQQGGDYSDCEPKAKKPRAE